MMKYILFSIIILNWSFSPSKARPLSFSCNFTLAAKGNIECSSSDFGQTQVPDQSSDEDTSAFINRDKVIDLEAAPFETQTKGPADLGIYYINSYGRSCGGLTSSQCSKNCGGLGYSHYWCYSTVCQCHYGNAEVEQKAINEVRISSTLKRMFGLQ